MAKKKKLKLCLDQYVCHTRTDRDLKFIAMADQFIMVALYLSGKAQISIVSAH